MLACMLAVNLLLVLGIYLKLLELSGLSIPLSLDYSCSIHKALLRVLKCRFISAFNITVPVPELSARTRCSPFKVSATG